MAKIARNYGKSRIWGEVFKNNKGSWINLKLGFQLGNITFNLKNDKKDGDLIVERIQRKNDGSIVKVPVGKAFKKITKNGKEVWNFTIGLIEEYDPETKKNLISTNDALFLTIITLDKDKQTTFKTKNGDEITKVGLVFGQLGMEIDINEDNIHSTVQKEENVEVEDDDIPF